MNIQSAPLRFRAGAPIRGDAPDTQLRALPTAGRVVAIVTTHNRCEQLRKTLVSLLSEPVLHIAGIVVVDNASSDGTAEFLAAIHDLRLTVLRLPRNTGGAGGFAAGLAHARARFDPDWYLLMDDDARPMPDALAAFHADDRAQWDAVAAAVYDTKGHICDINRPTHDPFASWRKFIRTLRKGREGFHIGPRDYAGDAVLPVDGASFVGLFLSRRGLTLAGLPEDRLFVYGDDALLTLRLSRNGGRIAFMPKVRFEHDYAAPACRDDKAPMWKTYYQHRNALILYRFAAGWLFWPICLIVIPRWFMRIRAYPGRKGQFLRLYLRGVLDGLRRKTSVEHDTVLHWAEPRG
ncbi:MAG: glycosyltransferase [Roseinatronobacter sp.]